MTKAQAFFERRDRLNEAVLAQADRTTKRFFALDHDAYAEGALPARTKELLGLVASAVLRCDDCVTYHLVRAREKGAKKEELVEALSIALVVGGSITVPHLREAFALLEELYPAEPSAS